MMFHVWHVLAIVLIFILGFILGTKNTVRIYRRRKGSKRWRDMTYEEKKKRIEKIKTER
jgi:hypothetical protein